MGQLHPVLSNTHVIQNALQAWQHPNSDQAKYVEQRVIKQLLQALILKILFIQNMMEKLYYRNTK